MKSLLLLAVLTITVFSCSQANRVEEKDLGRSGNSASREDLLESDTNSLTVLKTHYVLSLQGKKQEIDTQEQLVEILKKGYNRQDSLYVFIDDVPGDRIGDVMEVIRSAKVDKYKLIVKKEFFKLHYPDQN